jgi:class 3 adenylate cyclase
MGGASYRHYGALGEAVEAARRLALIAPPGEILLTPAFYEAVQGLLPAQPWTEAPAFLRIPLYRVSTGSHPLSPSSSTEKGGR